VCREGRSTQRSKISTDLKSRANLSESRHPSVAIIFSYSMEHCQMNLIVADNAELIVPEQEPKSLMLALFC